VILVFPPVLLMTWRSSVFPAPSQTFPWNEPLLLGSGAWAVTLWLGSRCFATPPGFFSNFLFSLRCTDAGLFFRFPKCYQGCISSSLRIIPLYPYSFFSAFLSRLRAFFLVFCHCMRSVFLPRFISLSFS